MGILQRGLNSKLNIEHPLQAQSDHGAILVVEASELPDRRIAGQPLLVTRNELREMGASNLFLTLDHPLDITWNVSNHLQERVYRHQARDDVSLIVARSPSIDSAILHRR